MHSSLVVGYVHAHSQRTNATTTSVKSTSKDSATAVNQACVLHTSLKGRRGSQPTGRQHAVIRRVEKTTRRRWLRVQSAGKVLRRREPVEDE